MSNDGRKQNAATGESGPIPLFVEGSEDTPFSAERMNGIVRPLNALLTMEIVRGSSDGVYISNSNFILQLARDQSGGEGGGNASWRGLWDSATEYAEGDMAYTMTGNNLVRLVWVAEEASTNQAPAYPETGTVYWTLIGVVGNLRRFSITAHAADYYTCDEANGDASGVNVYKAPELKNLASETIAGELWTYSAYNGDYTERTATHGSDTEKQVVIPYFINVQIDAWYDLRTSKWYDMNKGGRAWARKFDQT
jgi:hypothetical protein